MREVFKIGGVDYSDYLVDPNGIAFADDVSARSTLTIKLVDLHGFANTGSPVSPALPVEGLSWDLYDTAGTHVGGGTIDKIDQTWPVDDNGDAATIHASFLSLTCVDRSSLPDRRIVVNLWTNATPFTIVSDLVTLGGLDLDGVTVDVDDHTTVIPTFVADYQSVRDKLDALCTLLGRGWWIDESNVLHVKSRAAIACAFACTDATPNFVTMTVSRGRDQYRNRQYVRAGTDTTDMQTESFVGDGTRQTFTTKFPLALVPTVTVNGVSKTVGIRGVDTGKDWYWSKSTNQINQDTGASALTTGQTLAVTYQGQFPVLAYGQNDSAIAERKAIEGGAGWYDAIESQPQVNSSDLAALSVQALLAQFPLTTILTIVTDTVGARAGQLLTVNRTRERVSDEFLIKTVQVQDLGIGRWRYTITAASGTAVGGWVQYFLRLAQTRIQALQPSSDFLLLVRQVSDGLDFGDTLTVTSGAPETRIGFMTIGFGEIG